MTFYAESRNTAAEVLAGFHGLSLGALVATLMTWNEQRITRNRLSLLSDRELADIGLNRADIEAVAQGRHRR
ncbi:hypothetical protein ROE7235_00796 [Roseibaca ekhonensis]|jgi:uncharacterized protein YjiS (DUF1127 family)|uniref:YjiS-like domain-containing protein n=1 Tax=Roseinatronobacter ekhonensis TaxID=254356 RepID=A0A3B0MQ80_9RHOB|nr:DUF1127 domain-containing protein [Roseibaca ekhonensis]SUZ31064.1 hypothetical protein ROE7235_00796 [Roseibaca ekhonensis]